MYLLDTNIVSELRRPKPHGAVLVWFASVAEPTLFLSAVTIGELQSGVEATRRSDPDKAAELERWLDKVIASFKILAMDARTFRCWGRLMHRKSVALTEDAMIAATAEIHGLVVVTRNVRDFEPFGSRTLNPFEPISR